MTLKEWQILEQIQTLGELAKRLRVSNTTNPAMLVHKWLKGKAFPRKGNLERIVKATKGKVTPNDFLTQ